MGLDFSTLRGQHFLATWQTGEVGEVRWLDEVLRLEC